MSGTASAAPGTTWSEMRLLLMGERRGTLAALVVASVLAGLAESGVLAVVAQVAVALVSHRSDVRIDAGGLHLTGRVETLVVVGLLLACLRLALQAVIALAPARIAADMQARLREHVFSAFVQASWREQSRDREGFLQEVLTNQVAEANGGVLQATSLVVTISTFLVMVASAVVLNPAAAAVVVGAAVALFFALRPLSTLGRRRAQAVSRASLGYAGGVNESVRVAEEVHVFGIGTAERERVRKLLADLTTPFFHTQVLARLVPGLYQSLVYLLVLGALGGLYAAGAGRAASLGAVVLLLVRAGAYGQQAQAAYQAMRQALPYLERVQEAQRRYAAARATSGARRLTAIDELAFEAVSFGYEPNRPVLSELDFAVEGNQAIGVIGPSGAGKSTIAQILLRLRAPDSGRYLINGSPADEFADVDWHRLVAYVPQEPRLLHASVADNIRFRRDLDDAAVERAAKLAGIDGDIASWPHGYDTIVGPRSDAISGGQKQRICLARAVAARPALLVLDEPTSSLDPHSELAIHESLASLRHQLILVVIAHRMSTLNICDRVMTVVHGRVEAFEPVDALPGASPYYRSVSLLAASSALDTD